MCVREPVAFLLTFCAGLVPWHRGSSEEYEWCIETECMEFIGEQRVLRLFKSKLYMHSDCEERSSIASYSMTGFVNFDSPKISA